MRITGPKSLLDLSLPVKKSIILLEKQLETDHETFYQPYNDKRSSKKIIKKPSPLIIIFILKLIKKGLHEGFMKIKKHQRTIFNTQLLNSKKSRILKECFVQLNQYALMKE